MYLLIPFKNFSMLSFVIINILVNLLIIIDFFFLNLYTFSIFLKTEVVKIVFRHLTFNFGRPILSFILKMSKFLSKLNPGCNSNSYSYYNFRLHLQLMYFLISFLKLMSN